MDQGSLTLEGLPDEACGVVVLALTGDGSLEAHYRERAVTVVPPRGHVAAALIALAEQLARDAHDIEEQR